MPNRYQTERIQLILVSVFSLILGHSFGYAIEFLLVAVLGYLSFYIYKTETFFKWLKSGSKGKFVDQTGLWAEVINHVETNNRQQRKARAKYKSALRRVNYLTDALEQGVVILRQDYCLDWWNESAAKMIGLKKQDKGSPVTNLMRLPAFVSFISQKNFKKPLEIKSPSQPLMWLNISATQVEDNEIVLVITDITELNHLQQMRKDFVANVSHELRTPLTVLKGYADYLPQQYSDKKLNKALTQMAQQIHRMQLLADDLLLLSRIENEPEQIKLEKIKLKKLLKSVVVEAEALSQGKHEFKLECRQDVELIGSKTELFSLFSNLVFNAIRHNPEGARVKLKVSATNKWCLVECSDNGVGFDPIHIPRLTERFYRIDSSRNTETGGTGLGLAIAKHILQRHQANLYITAQIGKGASFVCKFPL